VVRVAFENLNLPFLQKGSQKSYSLIYQKTEVLLDRFWLPFLKGRVY